MIIYCYLSYSGAKCSRNDLKHITVGEEGWAMGGLELGRDNDEYLKELVRRVRKGS